MPIEVREQECTQSDGAEGSYVHYNTDTGEVERCFTDEMEAEIVAAQIRRSKES